MSDRRRLAAFGVVLAAALASGLGLGALLGPFDTGAGEPVVVHEGDMPPDHS